VMFIFIYLPNSSFYVIKLLAEVSWHALLFIHSSQRVNMSIVPNLEDVSEEILQQINHPKGWELVAEAGGLQVLTNEQELERFKRYINDNINNVTHKVDEFIAFLKQEFSIKIVETTMAIEADAAFHLNFLMERLDYLSTGLQAAKAAAERYFYQEKTVGYRYSFFIAEEYDRASFVSDHHKVKYVKS